MTNRISHHTLLGFVAILCWSTTIAVARTMSEQLGPLRTACWIHLMGGGTACLVVYMRQHQREALKLLPLRYWLGCGVPFVLYMLCMYLAVGLSENRVQTIGVSLLNYLWPTTTLVFSVWLLRQRATLWLVVGIAAATVGASLAVVGGDETAWSDLWRVFGVPHVLAICAGFLWGLYSALSRKLAGDQPANSVPVFVLATGLALLCLYPLFRTDATWTPRVIYELVYSALVPTFLAYIFWDLAVRKGDLTLVASLAYFTPLLSAVFSAIYLGVLLDAQLWAACGLIAGGAMICRASIIGNHAER